MAARRGLLLINLGSPAAPTTAAVRRYLNEFLTDPFVIDKPWLVRQLLVRGLITPLRAANSARAYQKIWTDEGSPLVNYTRSFAEKLQVQMGGDLEVRWAMRYGQPAIRDVVANWDAEEVLIVPLYPQFAESSTRTAIEEARKHLANKRLHILQDFYSSPHFISSEVRTIDDALNKYQADHLLLSFHGLPVHHLTKLHPEHCFESPTCCEEVRARNRFCYRAQCVATAKAIQAQLKFPKERVSYSFQSRLGRQPWIQPFTDHVVDELVAKGVRRLAVACPSFVADCLETLEEISHRLTEQFVTRGGESLLLIPSLNDQEHWLSAFANIVNDFRKSNT